MNGLGWWLPAVVPAVVVLAAAVFLMRLRRSPLRRLRDAEVRRRPDFAALRNRVVRLSETDPRRLTILIAAAACALGLLAGGPVAAGVLCAYSVFVVRAVLRLVSRRAAVARRAHALDRLCALAADLRAGLPPHQAATVGQQRATGAGGDGRITELTGAVWRLAERTGAPAADLVERIEADARAADRASASAAAQAAGAQATAMLLAALPLGGIGLGYSIGTDPLQILLHTRLGAACAIGAVLLQCAGLLWAERLVAGVRL